MELIDQRSSGTRVVRMVVQPKPASGEHELHGLAFKTGDQINRIPSRMLNNFAPAVRSWISTLWPELPEGESVDVNLATGSFAGCVSARRTVSFQGNDVESEVWFHPAIPITGMVRSRDAEALPGQRRHELELIDFGESGASSAFE